MAFTAGRDSSGRIVRQTSPLSAQTFIYDNANRLTQTIDHPAGAGCTARTYGYDPDSNRTSLTTAAYAVTGSTCAAPPVGTTVSHTFDAADRDTDPGYAYDELGRTLTVPAADTNGKRIAIAYNSNDMVASQTSGPLTDSWTTDPVGRLTTLTKTDIGNGGTATTSTTSHYDDSDDSPSWIATTAGSTTTWTRNVLGLGGELAAIQSSHAASA